MFLLPDRQFFTFSTDWHLCYQVTFLSQDRVSAISSLELSSDFVNNSLGVTSETQVGTQIVLQQCSRCVGRDHPLDSYFLAGTLLSALGTVKLER